MAAVNSTMQALGTPASDFSLNNVIDNEVVSLKDFKAKPVLVMFICNHCPYVVHIAERLSLIGNRALANGFAVVAISSNDADAYPQDGPAPMRDFAADYGFKFPYLFDESQAVAKAYGAACTPDFFVFDAAHKLQYRGQMDGSRPGNSVPVSGDDLSAALDAVASQKNPSAQQIASIGCNIKWRPGNAPDYF